MYPKVPGGFAAVLIVLLAVTAQAQTASASLGRSQDMEREFEFAPGGSLELNNCRGQIEVSGWEESRVEISVEKTVLGATDPALASQWLDKVRVEITREGNEIRVETVGGDKLPVEVNFWIKVPRRTDVEVKSGKSYVMLEQLEGDIEICVAEGSLLLQELSGDLEFSLANGPMLLERLRGSLISTTVNGNVQARLLGLDSSELRVINGKVTLGLPASAAVDLELSTQEGDIQIDPAFKVGRENDRRLLACKLNGGGSSVEVTSVRGQIIVEAL